MAEATVEHYRMVRNKIDDQYADPVLGFIRLYQRDNKEGWNHLMMFYKDKKPTDLKLGHEKWLEQLPPASRAFTTESPLNLQASRLLYIQSMMDYLLWTGQTKPLSLSAPN